MSISVPKSTAGSALRLWWEPEVQFRIAVTFIASLAKLTGTEQKAVKTTAFDLQMNPSTPGLSFHKLDRAKDKSFWSVRAGRDIRLIVHRTASSLLLAYVDHHDAAYRWAERRRIERHPKTVAAQIVEIRETVRETVRPSYGAENPPVASAKPVLFANTPEDDLLGYGVPAEWLEEVRRTNEDSLLDLAEHLDAQALVGHQFPVLQGDVHGAAVKDYTSLVHRSSSCKIALAAWGFLNPPLCGLSNAARPNYPTIDGNSRRCPGALLLG